jgi:general stress protein CsbA
MAGMTKVISEASDVNLVKVVVLGTVVALPLIVAMALRAISVKAGVETLIIALFVIMGVKVASMVSGILNG